MSLNFTLAPSWILVPDARARRSPGHSAAPAWIPCAPSPAPEGAAASAAADEAAKVFGEETRDSEPDATASNSPPTNLP